MLFESAALRDKIAAEYDAVEGLNQTLDRLSEELTQMTAAAEPQFEISRTFDAPRSLVWKAFTESDRLMHWWGPKGANLRVCNVDLRPGGTFLYSMATPGGEMWGKWVYREIAPPERLAFVNSFCDQAGNVMRAPFNPKWPLEVLNVVTFTESAGRTTISVRGGPIHATEEERQVFQAARSLMEQGFTGTFDQLEAYLATQRNALVVTTPSDRAIVLTRVFHAPRRLVFQAITQPEHVKRWYGPYGWNLEVCQIDLRVGGAWRYVMRGPDGRAMGLGGVYREIVPPERLVSTESFDDYPGESLNTLTLEEREGQTTLTVHVLHASNEVRDAVLKSGMEQGAGETFNRLAEELAALSGGG